MVSDQRNNPCSVPYQKNSDRYFQQMHPAIHQKQEEEISAQTSQSCNKSASHTVTITTDAIDEFSQALVDCLNKYMDSNLSDDMMDQMGVTKDQLKQSIGTIPSLVSAVMTKDAVANVYVENDKVIRVDWDYDLAAAGVKISFTADYMGDGNVTSDAVTKIALTYGSDVNIELKSESKTDTSGDKISTDKKYTLSAMSGGESQEFTGNVTSDYDKNSGKMSGSISVDVQGETAQAAFEGALAKEY